MPNLVVRWFAFVTLVVVGWCARPGAAEPNLTGRRADLGIVKEASQLGLDPQLLSSFHQERRRLEQVDGWYSYMEDARFPTMDGDTSTRAVDVGNAQLGGTIPSQIGLMTDLEWVCFGSNEFSGEVPTQLGRLTKITSITEQGFIGNNDFTPDAFRLHYQPPALAETTIPSELGLWTGLRDGGANGGGYSSFMNNAHLGGTIPTELGQWTALTANLNLESNNLCGDVPTQLEALSSGFSNTDTWKVTEGNSFIGTPCWQLMMTVGGGYIHVGDTTKTDMPYSSHDLGGSIPTEFGMYTDVVAFNLKDNSMLGTVPTQLGLLSKLTWFDIRGNRCCDHFDDETTWGFSSTMPTQLGLLTKVENDPDNDGQQFGLSKNSFTGRLPSELGNLVKMATGFSLGDQPDVGESIPTQFGKLSLLSFDFEVYSTKVCGDIPTEVERLRPSDYSAQNWLNTSGTSLGTPCLTPTGMPSTPPTLVPTITPRCDAGEEFDSARQCRKCPIGYFTEEHTWENRTNCTLCATGKYNQAVGSGFCADCATGRVATDDRSNCNPCAPGTFVKDSSTCVDCPSGYYAPTAQTDACIACTAGDHTNSVTNATECSSCDAGTYSEDYAFQCISCEAGTYSNTRASECSTCDEGKYSGANASFCESCSGDVYGTGYTSEEGSSGCYRCLEDYFRTLDGVCEEVQDEGFEKKVGNTLRGLSVEKGFYRFGQDSATAYECPYSTHCVGGVYNETGSSQCGKQSTGPLCAVCQSDFYFDSHSAECTSCLEYSTPVGAIVVVMVLVILASAAVFNWARGGFGPAEDESEDSRKSRLSVTSQAGSNLVKGNWLFFCKTSKHSKNKIKIFISFAQLCSGLDFVLDLRWPEPCQTVMDAMSSCNLEIFSLVPFACVFETDYFTNLVVSSLAPIITSAVLLAVYLTIKAKGSEAASTNFLITLILLISYLVLPNVSSTVFATFKCNEYDAVHLEKEGSVERYLAMDFSVSCDSPYYSSMEVYAALMVLVYPIGIPLLYIVALYKERADLSIPEHQLAGATYSQSLATTFFGYHAHTAVVLEDKKKQEALDAEWEKLRETHYLSFLISAYSRRVYWFEVVEVFRRLLLSGMLILFGSGTVRQVLCAIMICLCSIRVFSFYTAFHDAEDSILSEVAQYQLLMILVIGLVLRYDSLVTDAGGESTIADRGGLGALLTVIIFIGPVLLVILGIVTEVKERKRKQEGDIGVMAGSYDSGNPIHGGGDVEMSARELFENPLHGPGGRGANTKGKPIAGSTAEDTEYPGVRATDIAKGAVEPKVADSI